MFTCRAHEGQPTFSYTLYAARPIKMYNTVQAMPNTASGGVNQGFRRDLYLQGKVSRCMVAGVNLYLMLTC